MSSHKVDAKALQRFAAINEKLFEQTAKAESQAFQGFKDLSFLQIQCIRLIAYHQPCKMSDLANSMGVGLASITQLIDRLIKKDYVKRQRSEQDRRVVYAELTTKGKRVMRASKKHVDTVGHAILSKFNAQEQQAMLDFFERMAED